MAPSAVTTLAAVVIESGVVPASQGGTAKSSESIATLRSRFALSGPSHMFSVIDRLDAEAELRLTLAPALLGVAAALGWRATPWIAAVLMLATAVLVMQGQARSTQATESVVEALRLGRTRIPLFDQIEDAIEECRTQLAALP